MPGPPPIPPQRRWRTALLVGIAIVVGSGIGVLLVRAPTPAATYGPTEIDLLPSENTRSACIVGVLGEPRPTLDLHYGTLQGNTYDVPTGTTGHVGMCYNATTGSLFAYANWSNVGSAGGWFSYPQVTYGVNDYLGAETTYTNQSPAWALPQTVNATVHEDLWVTATYALRAPPSSDVSGYDLSFDDFVSQGLPPRLDQGPFVEVEIFLAHNISYPFVYSHWSMPTLVNGSVTTAPWDVGYWCHGTDNGSNANVSFDFSYGGQATHGLARGTIGVNLSAVFAEVEALIGVASCWTGPASEFSQFYLGEEDLGSEDGAVGGASYDYNWTVRAYCLHTDVLLGGNVSCGAAAPVRPLTDAPEGIFAAGTPAGPAAAPRPRGGSWNGARS